MVGISFWYIFVSRYVTLLLFYSELIIYNTGILNFTINRGITTSLLYIQSQPNDKQSHFDFVKRKLEPSLLVFALNFFLGLSSMTNIVHNEL